MEALLIVLVAGCGCMAAVRTGKGFWAKSRSVERHHQALDTLGDITRAEVPSSASSRPPEGHQAHVRIIPADASAPLPPARASWASNGAPRPSPLRRPSTRPQPPVATPEQTLPGRVPPEVLLPLDERATRPVPVARAQVFYFDDLGTKSAKPSSPPSIRPGATGALPTGAPVPLVANGQTRDSAGGDIALGDEPGARPGADAGNNGAHPGRGPDEAGTGPEGTLPAALPGATKAHGLATAPPGPRRPRAKPLAASALAVTAVCLALVAVALSLTGGNGARAAGHSRSRDTSKHTTTVPTRRSDRPRAKRPATTTTTKPPAPTTTRPPVATLVASGNGTDSYRLGPGHKSVTIQAGGACWVEVKGGGPSGPLLFVGTLQAGQHYSFDAPAWARLGDPPQVSVRSGANALKPPGLAEGSPLDLVFSVG